MTLVTGTTPFPSNFLGRPTPEVRMSAGEHLAHTQHGRSSKLSVVCRMSALVLVCTDAQCMTILFQIQHYLEAFYEETTATLFPAICSIVHEWSCELQLTSARVLHKAARAVNLPNTVLEEIATAAFEVVSRTQEHNVLEAWGELLVTVLPDVRWRDNDEISSVVAIVDGCTNSKNAVCRKVAARVLGSLSKCLSLGDVETIVLTRALHLASDRDPNVRGMIAESLASISIALDVLITESHIWAKLVVLLEDSDARIRGAALKTVQKVASAKREDPEWARFYQILLLPFFEKECGLARLLAEKDMRKVGEDDYSLLEEFARVFGPCLSLTYSQVVTDRYAKSMLLTFKAMVTCNGPVVRRRCAKNLSGIAKCLGGRFKLELAAILLLLSKDADCETRWNAASNIHLTIRSLLGKHSAEQLLKAVTALLQDSDELVRETILINLSETFTSLSSDTHLCPYRKLAPLVELLPSLPIGKWRTQELLMSQLEKILPIVSVEGIQRQLLPLISRVAEESTYLVRKAAMKAMAKAVWCFPFPQEKATAAADIKKRWGQGQVFWMRLAYIDAAEAASKLFSTTLFNALFGEQLFKLCDDAVPNVRLKLARGLAEVAPLCYNHEGFQSALTKLEKDADEEIKFALTGVHRRLQIRTQWQDAVEKENKCREALEKELHEQARRSEVERRRKTRQALRVSSVLPRLGKSSGSADSPSSDVISPLGVMDTMNVTSALKRRSAFALGMRKHPSGRAGNEVELEPPETSSPGTRRSKSLGHFMRGRE